jgi:hypothetical protein
MDQGAARARLPYLDFEDERLAELDGSQLGFLLEEYERLQSDLREEGPMPWSFDEIQVVPGWERSFAGNAPRCDPGLITAERELSALRPRRTGERAPGSGCLR